MVLFYKKSKINKSNYNISCLITLDKMWIDLLENLKQGIYHYEIIPLLEQIGDNFDVNDNLKLVEIEKEVLISIDEDNIFSNYMKRYTYCDELRNYINILYKK
jgi:hypothetical protein